MKKVNCSCYNSWFIIFGTSKIDQNILSNQFAQRDFSFQVILLSLHLLSPLCSLQLFPHIRLATHLLFNAGHLLPLPRDTYPFLLLPTSSSSSWQMDTEHVPPLIPHSSSPLLPRISTPLLPLLASWERKMGGWERRAGGGGRNAKEEERKEKETWELRSRSPLWFPTQRHEKCTITQQHHTQWMRLGECAYFGDPFCALCARCRPRQADQPRADWPPSPCHICVRFSVYSQSASVSISTLRSLFCSARFPPGSRSPCPGRVWWSRTLMRGPNCPWQQSGALERSWPIPPWFH